MGTVKKIKKFQQFSSPVAISAIEAPVLLPSARLVNEYNLFWWIEQSPQKPIAQIPTWPGPKTKNQKPNTKT